MSYATIRQIIESRMAAWPDAPVAFDGVPASEAVVAAQDAKDPWVRLTIQPGATLPAGKGSEPHVRPTGLISVQIFTKPGIGSNTALTLCDSLAAHLQHKLIGSLETLQLSVSRTGEQDGYYQLNASVPYRFN